MKRLRSILTFIITLLIPIILLLTSIWIVMTPLYPVIEYNRPGFPVDEFGFSKTDRLKYGQISIQYLLNNRDISFLSEQKLADGTPLYNERELSHMLDVKNLVQASIKAWLLLIGILIVATILAFWQKWMSAYWRAVARGGWVAVGLVVFIIAAVLISFTALFTGFHEIFFKGDTWLFLYTDSLIRLFPMPFWEDAFIYVGAITLLGGLLAAIGGKKLAKRAEKG